MGLNSYRNCILYTFVKQQVECVAICDTVFMVCVWRLVDMAVTKSANVNVRIQENIKQQAEQILETIGVPRATAIDMFYRQIILNKGIPFLLTIPKSLPAQDDMYEKTFNALMSKGYDQAARGDSYPIDDVFEELER